MKKGKENQEGLVVPNNPALVEVRRHTSILSENISSSRIERRVHLSSIEKLKDQLKQIEESSVFSVSLSLQEAARLKRSELNRLGCHF